ncbi:MAG: hypothetical protein XD78_0438 [Desulfotomaculum sp. 46_296]|nr:MAG: hypothetical protein XD78_0438 [Desulfotomaculum sp. 46_296]HAU31381.1 hypothetical protein [Desulfotomaculum sp.]
MNFDLEPALKTYNLNRLPTLFKISESPNSPARQNGRGTGACVGVNVMCVQYLRPSGGNVFVAILDILQ